MDSQQQPPSPRRRWLRRVLLVGVLFELVYILAFEWAVRSGSLQRWIHRRPEKVVVTFASAHSFVPFRVSVSGFEVHTQTPKARWRVRVDEASGWISPFALFRRALRVPWVEVSGGEFWFRREDEYLSAYAASLSSSEREKLLPALAPLPPLPVPRPPSAKPNWSFELPRIDVTDFREVWIDGVRLAGEFDAGGGFSMYSGREVEVVPSRVALRSVRATIGETEIGRGLEGAMSAHIVRYPYKEKRGRAMLPFLSGRADVRGALADGELLSRILRRAPWVSFGSTLGELEAHLVLESGDLRPGSRVELRHPRLETKVFDFRAVGDARVQFEVQPAGPAGAQEQASLSVVYDNFDVHGVDPGERLFHGSGLSLVAETSSLELGSILESTRLKIDLGAARIPNLAVFNEWLPATSGLALVSGAGALTGVLDADLAANQGQGEFRAAIEGAHVRYHDLDLLGSVTVGIQIPEANLERRSFELAGSRLDLTGFRVLQMATPEPSDSAAGWWAHFTLDEGRLTLPPEPSARARFTVNLRDSVPLVGLFETRKNLPKWVANLLTVEDIRAGGNFAWSPAETRLDELATQIRSASVQGRIRFGHDLRKGLLMVEWHRLALGLRIDEARKEWKFIGVRAWYESSDLGSPPAGRPADDPLSEAALAHAELGGEVDFSQVALPSVDFAYEVVPGSPLSGELDGDRGREAVALIALPSVAEARALRLVAVDLVGGRAIPIGSVDLAPGTEVRSLAIEDRKVVVHLLTQGAGGGAGPARSEETWRWAPRAGKRVEPVRESDRP